MSAPAAAPLLSSLRILELGHFIAAPFCTRVLADLGPDVLPAFEKIVKFDLAT